MFDHETLAAIWFVVTALLLMVYFILDGFDLGVGILHPIAKTEQDRQLMMRSIGPFWNGNEVWLVTFGGVLFGAFPSAYGTLISGFYELVMLLLFGLIFRAVSLEFRSQVAGSMWRTFWDSAFWMSSFLVTMLFGIVIGNVVLGVPLGRNLVIEQGVLGQLNFYSLLVGFCFTSLFALHGSLFLYLKTQGDLRKHVHAWTRRLCFIFLLLFLLVAAMTCRIDRVAEGFSAHRWLWILVTLNGFVLASMLVALLRHKALLAFLGSSATIASTSVLVGAIVFPTLVYSTIDSSWNLTIYNASSSTKSLNIMLIFAMIGFPFVIAYTIMIYRIFWSNKATASQKYL